MTPTVFQFNGAVVRTDAADSGEPLFCAIDVCAVLGYKNSPDSIAKHCKQSGVVKRDIASDCGVSERDSTSRARVFQEMTFITEGNLYRLIIKSRKPEAERFEAWVCDEVLPTIRKTGAYTHPQAQEAVADQVAIPSAEYIQLLKKCAEQAEKCVELAELKAKAQHVDHCFAVARNLIDQGRHTREQIAAIAGLTLEATDYLHATYGATRSRTVGGAPFVVCKG